jgi:hypothetical protein
MESPYPLRTMRQMGKFWHRPQILSSARCEEVQARCAADALQAEPVTPSE